MSIRAKTTAALAASVAGVGIGLLTLATLTQRPAEAAPQPRAPAREDEEKRAQQALAAAEARYKEAAARLAEATKQLEAARANQERARAARAAGALRRQFQSVDWYFLRAGTEGSPSGLPVTTIRITATNKKGLAASEPIPFLSLEVPLAKGVEVQLDGREGKVTDLRLGARIALRLARDGAEVVKIEATSPRRGAFPVLKAIDARKNTITVALPEKGTLENLPVDEDEPRFSIDDRRGQLTDLKPGMRVFLSLAVRNGVIVVREAHTNK
jgi:hypothetical protein